MKDFPDASVPPETILIMRAALEAAVASLPEPVGSAHVQAIAETILRSAKDGERDPAILQRMALMELQMSTRGWRNHLSMVEDAGFRSIEAVEADAILNRDPTSRRCLPTSRCQVGRPWGWRTPYASAGADGFEIFTHPCRIEAGVAAPGASARRSRLTADHCERSEAFSEERAGLLRREGA
jgi:hypothetical protein